MIDLSSASAVSQDNDDNNNNNNTWQVLRQAVIHCFGDCYRISSFASLFINLFWCQTVFISNVSLQDACPAELLRPSTRVQEDLILAAYFKSIKQIMNFDLCTDTSCCLICFIWCTYFFPDLKQIHFKNILLHERIFSSTFVHKLSFQYIWLFEWHILEQKQWKAFKDALKLKQKSQWSRLLQFTQDHAWSHQNECWGTWNTGCMKNFSLYWWLKLIWRCVIT